MKLSLLVFTALFLFAGVAYTFEDNEFADFEEFEDEVEEPAPKVQQQAKASDFVETDDSDDGIVEDEFDPFTDKDEFEGFAGTEEDSAETKKPAGEPKLTMAKVPLPFRRWDAYWVEILFIAGLCVYFVNYAMGKNKNVKIAEKFLLAHRSFLEENFALVGDDGKKETESSETALMMKESDSVFTLWCSGRVCVEGMLVELKLIKRQDLLSLTMGMLSAKTQDQVVMKTEISRDSMDSFVMAVCSKKSASKMFKDLTDLKQYCVSVAKPDEKYNIPAGFSLLSEIAEASAAILDTKVVAMLNKYSSVIDSIHISDQFSGSALEQQDGSQPMKQPETKKMLIVSFFINDKTDMEELRPLLQLVIYLVGEIGR
jgi:hypothetical protein